MTLRARFRTLLTAAATATLVLPAFGQVMQLDGTPLPQPVCCAPTDPADFNTAGLEWALVTNSWSYRTDTRVNRDAMGVDVWNNEVYFGDVYPTFENGDAITLEGLFKFRGESIDPVADARTDPGYFSPQCGFSGQMVLRGGDCQVAFGWYNVADPNSTTPPPADQIYEFIPPNISEYLMCQGPLDNGFCPLAWDNVDPRDMSRVMWQPQAFDSGMIQSDPRFTGPYIGFAVIGNPSSSCTATKYSMKEHNSKSSMGPAWVTTIVYQSTVDPEGFYLAFEDLPMSAGDWRTTGVQGMNAMNDGDFNDFVFFISGLSCEGGGQPCTTDLLGACSLGRTDCTPADGSAPACRPVIQPGNELCDNIDNDCNGAVDDGEGLCEEGLFCHNGACVGNCGTGEFVCDAGLVCDGTLCVEEACVGVACTEGQACRGGVCVSGCDGVVCPANQECQLGRCVNPCSGVECPAGRVCERGLCVSDCACRGCSDGLVCGMDGRCTDPACDGVVCDGGFVCSAGTCIDPCIGVTCPGNGVCMMGTCTDPTVSVGGATGAGGTGVSIGGTLSVGGSVIVTGAGGTTSTTGSGGSAPIGQRGGDEGGCGCRLGSRPSTYGALLGLALIGAVGWRRRRRAA